MPNHVKNIIKLTGAQNEINYIVNLITKTEEVDGETQRVVDFNSLIPMPETLNVVSGGCADECLKLYISDVFCNDDIYGTKLKKHLDVLQRYNNSKLFGKVNITTECLYTLAEISDKCSKLLEQYHADRKRIPFDEGPWFRTTADVIAYGEQIYNNIEKYNAKDWYDWRTYDNLNDPNNDNIGWGTKWNAYDNRCETFSGYALLRFNTAWNVPFKFYKKLYNVIHNKCKNISCNIRYANEDCGSGIGEITDIIGDRVQGLNYLEEYEDDELEEIYGEIWEE